MSIYFLSFIWCRPICENAHKYTILISIQRRFFLCAIVYSVRSSKIFWCHILIDSDFDQDSWRQINKNENVKSVFLKKLTDSPDKREHIIHKHRVVRWRISLIYVGKDKKNYLWIKAHARAASKKPAISLTDEGGEIVVWSLELIARPAADNFFVCLHVIWCKRSVRWHTSKSPWCASELCEW